MTRVKDIRADVLLELREEIIKVQAMDVIVAGNFNEDAHVKMLKNLWYKWDCMTCLVKFMMLKKET